MIQRFSVAERRLSPCLRCMMWRHMTRWRRDEFVEFWRCMFRPPLQVAPVNALPVRHCGGEGGASLRVQFSASLSVERGSDGAPREEDRVAEWIRRAQDGDPDSFDRLMGLHQSLCYAVAYRKLSDVDMAAESCQEAMLSAWRSIGSFSGTPKRFRSWLMRIVVNQCIDRLRYESRRPRTVSLDADEDDAPWLEPPAEPGPSVERLAETEDMKARLDRAIDRVPEPYRTALALHLCEFTYSEIAASLGVDVGTVSSRLSRARGHLRAELAGASDKVRSEASWSDRPALRGDDAPPEAFGSAVATGD